MEQPKKYVTQKHWPVFTSKSSKDLIYINWLLTIQVNTIVSSLLRLQNLMMIMLLLTWRFQFLSEDSWYSRLDKRSFLRWFHISWDVRKCWIFLIEGEKRIGGGQNWRKEKNEEIHFTNLLILIGNIGTKMERSHRNIFQTKGIEHGVDS